MFGHRDRNELDLVLEEVVQLSYHIFPIAEGNVAELANVKLLKVILLFETCGKDRIGGNIFDRVVIAMPLLFVLLGVLHLEFEQNFEDLVASTLS